MERIWLHKSFEANPAPPLSASRWFNTERAPSLDELRGRVVVLLAFQVVCPACVLHGLPQAARIRSSFDPDEVSVLGIHATFEHGDPTSARALGTFLHEYGIDIPVGYDEPSAQHAVNVTDAYGFAGTPSMVLIDREGLLRAHVLGRPSDILVGAAIGTLLSEERLRPVVRTRPRLIKPVQTAAASNDDWLESWSSNWGT